MNDVIGNSLVLGHFRSLVVPLLDVAAWGLLDLKLRVNHVAMVATADVTLLLSRAGVGHGLRLRVPGPDLRRNIGVLGFPASVSKVGEADESHHHQDAVIG